MIKLDLTFQMLYYAVDMFTFCRKLYYMSQRASGFY